ncbi:MAG: eL32 family ribosomal protein [Candidatus Woesearchaeota archaeon]
MTNLEIRNDKKAKKPTFVRQNAGYKKRVSLKYRKPRGCSSRMRLKLKGYPANLSQGYRSPQDVRGLTHGGLNPVVVSDVASLKTLDAKKDCVVIGGTVGTKKMLTIFEEAQKLKLTIDNRTQESVAALQKQFDDRVAQKTAAKKKAQKKLEEQKAKATKKSEKTAAKSDDKESAKKDANDEKKEEIQQQEKIITNKKTAM